MRIFQFLTSVILFTTIFITEASASDYSIPDIKVEVSIQSDGTLLIREHRTYHFDGDFSWADYRLPKEGFSEIRNIRVSEDDEAFINENSEQPGTFSVSESSESVIIKWHYRASDENRTFTISYELKGAVSVGPEWTEFLWNFVAAGRERSTESLDIDIHLPSEISPDSLYAWSHGDESTVIKQERGRWIIAAQNISRNDPVIIRALFPASVFNQSLVSVTDPNLTLESIIQDEENDARQREQERERREFYASITLIVTIIISLFSIGIFYLVYQKFGKRYSANTVSKRETVMIPGRIEPAIIGRLLMKRHTTIQHFTATLFDLGRRGYFTIHEEKKEKKWYSTESSEFRIKRTGQEPGADLKNWEKDLLEFVERRVISGKDTFAKLFEGSSSSITKWYSSWKKKVKEAFDERNWIDKTSYKGVYLNLAFQFLLLIPAVYLLIMGTGAAFAGLAIIAFMIILSAVIIRRTKEGEETYQRWKAYRDGLKSADKRTIRMELLDRHFIYSTAFHLSQKQMTVLLESAADEHTVSLFPWILLSPGSASTPSSIAASMSTMAASGTTSFSGTTGGSGASTGSVGGGASGGAG